MKLSVVLSVYNEEKNIARCLESVKNFADEIIVVDHESTDKTVSIAKKYTKNVFIQKNDAFDIDRQKNFGFEKAKGEWILSLDADEYLTKEATKEIKEKIEDKSINGYWIPRKNIIFGKWMQHTGWSPDEQLRLFRNGKGKYTSKHVHEDLEIEGKVGHITSPLVHENYQTVSQFVERNFLRYAPNEAENLIKNGYRFSYTDALYFPSKEFLSRYFAREGYKDGLHGLILSLLLAAYHLIIFANIWEKQHFPQEEQMYSPRHVEFEAEKISEEFRYWFNTEEINLTKNSLKKILLKAKRKLS